LIDSVIMSMVYRNWSQTRSCSSAERVV